MWQEIERNNWQMSETSTDRISKISVLAEEVNKARVNLSEKEKALVEYVDGIQAEINDAKIKAGLKISSSSHPTYGRGARTAEVERHYKDGKTVDEIAEAMKIPPNIVKRLLGKIKAASENDAQPERLSEKSKSVQPENNIPASLSPSADDDDEEDSKAASTQQLLDAMGTRKITTFKTTSCRGHQHVAQVDIFGAGRTLSDSSGHSHRIRNFCVTNQANHIHSLTVMSGGEVSSK